MSYALTSGESQFDRLLATRISSLASSTGVGPNVLLKLQLTDHLTPGSPLSSIALSLLVKHGHRFLHEQMVCRQLVQAVKNALDRSKIGTAAIKDKLGLMGAYTDFGLALEIARWFVSEIEAANGTGEVGMRAGEVSVASAWVT